MKNLICIALFLLFGKLAFAQHDPKIEKFIGQIITQDNIVYEDSISRHDIHVMRIGIQDNKAGVFYKMRDDSLILIDRAGKRTMISGSAAVALFRKSIPTKLIRIVSDSLIITPKERAYIYSEINKMAHYKWDDVALINWRILPADTIAKVFGDRNHDGWEDLQKKNINRIYGISVPIFLRNDTYCLFYYGYSCPGRFCGEGGFAIYKKEDGLWKYWARISSWIS